MQKERRGEREGLGEDRTYGRVQLVSVLNMIRSHGRISRLRVSDTYLGQTSVIPSANLSRESFHVLRQQRKIVSSLSNIEIMTHGLDTGV